jgi:Asp-tRNA(Asn)/Glu-tRNA(Gln) amidotransferase A subunit family amidase
VDIAVWQSAPFCRRQREDTCMPRDEAPPAGTGAIEAARLIRDGRLTSLDCVQACLERIQAREPEVQAWTYLDPDHALDQARRRDEQRRSGAATGPLHGVPVALKDIVDTADMPTENGTVLHAGRRPRHDAAVTERLRSAGAVILGKTVTTELAFYTPGKTRNPHDPARTPGGSSSGSAAAVADGMVPLALGSQTNGSIVRPASFCGVVGFKPTHGLISRYGMLRASRFLDHVGIFARSVEDAALAGDVLAGFDARDPDTRPTAAPLLLQTATADWPLEPDFAFVRTPQWDRAEPYMEDAFGELLEALGPRISEQALPDGFARALDMHTTIVEPDLALNYGPEYERGRDQLSPRMVELIERGQKVPARDYNATCLAVPLLRQSLDGWFDRFDALVTPAAPGEAPVGLGATGDPAFCTTWTLLGMPAVTLPLLEGPSGMPVGVQLIGQWGQDARLLRTARWLVQKLRR